MTLCLYKILFVVEIMDQRIKRIILTLQPVKRSFIVLGSISGESRSRHAR